MVADGSTVNFSLVLPRADRLNWTDLANGNFKLIDAVMGTFVSVSNLKGLWQNNFVYAVGDNVVDEDTGVVWTAQVAHTSASRPDTFADERTNHPTYWLTFAVAARNRGAWQTNTAYSLNDFVVSGSQYAVAIVAHTSGASFAVDLAAGKWSVLVDLSAAGSLVLPILGGATDANKVVMSNAAGLAYVVNSLTTLLDLFDTTGSGKNAREVSPIFNNASGNTPAVEDFDTSLATTLYADRAVRALIPRVQTFAVNGTYTPHSKMVYAELRCIGGGGGGGGCAASAPNNGYGAQGGSGSYSVKWVTPTDIGVSKAVTIGPAGTAGTAGNNAGGTGGDTSIGTLCIGKGAAGGSGTNSGGAAGIGGLGGVAGTGDYTFIGNSGASGHLSANVSVAPASVNVGSFLGGAPVGLAGAAAGTSATANTGAGGGGGFATAGGANQAGGAGGTGYAIVIEYCYG